MNFATLILAPNQAAARAFDCSLDGSGWAPCDGGQVSYFGLAEGSHVFLVRARGPNGAVDPTPAYRAWVVDDGVPDTLILAAPDDPSQSSAAEFFFGASVSEVDHYMCALDRGSRPSGSARSNC